MNPTITFIIVILIGIVAGVIAQRGVRRSWLARRFVDGTRADITSALVGIAGAFIGFHLAALVILSGGEVALFLGAVIGAVLILLAWKTVRL